MATTKPPRRRTSGKGDPVGVDKDYVAPRATAQPDYGDEGLERERAAFARESGQYQQGPRFFEGDLDKPRGWSPGAVAGLQSDLVAAGLLSEKGFALGEYDDRTRNAYKKVLSYANQLGVDADTAFGRLLKAGFGGRGPGGGGASRAPFHAELPNPDDVKAVVDATVPNIIGRTLTDDEKAAVIAAYNAVATGAQQNAYNTAASGGTTTEAPAIDTFVASKAKELHPEEADLFGKFNLVGDVTRLLGLGQLRSQVEGG